MSHVRKIIYRAGVNSCLTHGRTSTRYQALLIPPPFTYSPPPLNHGKLIHPHPFPERPIEVFTSGLRRSQFGTPTPENSHLLKAKSKVTVKANKDFPRTPSLGKSFWIRAWSPFIHSRDVSIPKEHDQFLLRNWLLVLVQIG